MSCKQSLFLLISKEAGLLNQEQGIIVVPTASAIAEQLGLPVPPLSQDAHFTATWHEQNMVNMVRTNAYVR